MKSDLLISAENIMDCLNDGVYVCDRDRRIVYWSKAAERISVFVGIRPLVRTRGPFPGVGVALETIAKPVIPVV